MSSPPEPAGRDSRQLPTHYTVAREKPAAASAAVERMAPAPARPLYAVLVTHGMGQQLPFQTLDQIAEGLRQEDASRQPGKPVDGINAANVEIGKEKEKLQRIELQLGPEGEGCDVHIYEGYWAPLTEGQVTLRNVMSFLLNAGSSGIANGTGQFRRWLFGQYRSFVTPVRIVLYLLIALAATVSLVVINTAIVTVAAARSPLVQPPPWLSDGLIGDLSTAFNALLLVAGLFALSLWVSSRWRSRWLGILSATLFVLALFAIIATAVALPCLFFLHLKQGKVGPETSAGIDPEILTHGHRWVAWLNTGVEALILLAALGALVWALVWFLRRIAAKRSRKMAETGLAHFLSVVATVVFWLMLAGLAAEIVLFFMASRALPGMGAFHTLLRGVSWAVLVGLSLFVRNFLIQYVGDVAVYVTPHRLDRFNDLRHRIQDTVLNRARAVYEATVEGNRYSKVLIAGHSLGSVISYDVLNRLLSEDETAKARGETGLGVAERTGLLLTFGSLLNKTAFLFAVQGKNETDEAREALAASIQPLISDEELRRRLPWVNVYSPWDLFSGSLKFYDPADATDEPPLVDNQFDRGAGTLILAHTQYWRQGGLIYSVLYDHLWPGQLLDRD
jgi:hypothetical protein